MTKSRQRIKIPSYTHPKTATSAGSKKNQTYKMLIKDKPQQRGNMRRKIGRRMMKRLNEIVHWAKMFRQSREKMRTLPRRT